MEIKLLKKILCICSIGLFGLVTACGVAVDSEGNVIPNTGGGLFENSRVTLEATGSGTVSYSDSGNMTLGETFDSFWTKDVEWRWLDTFTVQNDYMNPGPVSCKIVENGVVVSENTSNQGMVSCTK